MHRRIIASVALACALVAGYAARPVPAGAATTHLNHIYYIMMENQSFDGVIGRDDANYNVDTPFITQLALTYGLSAMSFGTTHPSLPNYLSLVGGDYYGIQDDNASCFANPKPTPCDTARGQNLVDLLEAKHLTWIDLQQSMPSVGYLGTQYPTSPSGPVHYAQKHNPFLYYKDIATNATRLQHVVPLKNMNTLASLLTSPQTAPNFVFIAPDQCHDMHGTADCPSGDALLKAGDLYVKQLVTTITRSKAWGADSAIFIVWDEDDYSSRLGCCYSVFPKGGGHMAAIVVTPRYTAPIQMSVPSNHYNELRTIEDELGLPHLGNSARVPPTFEALLP